MISACSAVYLSDAVSGMLLTVKRLYQQALCKWHMHKLEQKHSVAAVKENTRGYQYYEKSMLFNSAIVIFTKL